MTRAQMATSLVRAYEAATGNTLRAVRDVFTDDAGSVHEASIDRAAVAGLAVGRTTTTYRTQDTVNREQMATFLARLLDRVQRDQGFSMFGPGVPAPAMPAQPTAARLMALSAGQGSGGS
jgi:hypothetical protein